MAELEAAERGKIKLYYYRHKNPDGFGLTGVPLRDITEEEWQDLPAHKKASVVASKMYYKTKPEGWVSQAEYDAQEHQKLEAAAKEAAAAAKEQAGPELEAQDSPPDEAADQQQGQGQQQGTPPRGQQQRESQAQPELEVPADQQQQGTPPAD